MISELKFKLMVSHKMTYWDKIEDYKKLLNSMALGYLGSYQDRIEQATQIAIHSSPDEEQKMFFEVAKNDLMVIHKPAQAA